MYTCRHNHRGDYLRGTFLTHSLSCSDRNASKIWMKSTQGTTRTAGHRLATQLPEGGKKRIKKHWQDREYALQAAKLSSDKKGIPRPLKIKKHEHQVSNATRHPPWSGLARTIYIYIYLVIPVPKIPWIHRICIPRVVQFEVRSKVWVRELSQTLTNLKVPFGIRSEFDELLKVQSNFTACVCQNDKGEQPPPVHSFLAVKITCSKINTRNLSVICTRPGVSLVLRPNKSHIFAKDLYKAALALHLKVLLFLLYNYDMVSFRPPFSPYNFL